MPESRFNTAALASWLPNASLEEYLSGVYHHSAMEAGLTNLLFWGSLAAALLIAGVIAYPVNRWLIARGKGHAVVHAHHAHG